MYDPLDSWHEVRHLQISFGEQTAHAGANASVEKYLAIADTVEGQLSSEKSASMTVR